MCHAMPFSACALKKKNIFFDVDIVMVYRGLYSYRQLVPVITLFPKAPVKRSQHANATYRNIVGPNMLRAFGHCVATCWVLLAQI